MGFGIGDLIGGGLSLFGALSAGRERAQAQKTQLAAINDFSSSGDAQYQNVLANNARGLNAAAGQGGDAINVFARNTGSANAAGGVYNSSAVAGGIASAQRGVDSSLANIAAQNTYNANALHNANAQQVANMRLGLANQQNAIAIGDQQTARSGLTSFLGGLAQRNLQQSGGRAAMGNLPLQNGTQGQVAGLQGDTGYDASPGILSAPTSVLPQFQPLIGSPYRRQLAA